MIRVRLFGRVSITREDGTEARSVLAQPMRLAILSYLAATEPDGFRSRDEVLAMFWPEKDSWSARNALRQALHFLRRSLGPSAIDSPDDHRLRLNPAAVWTDLASFREAVDAGRVADAVELYEGPFLDGLPSGGAAAFEHWRDRQQERLDRIFIDLAGNHVADLEGEGRLDAALALCHRLVDAEPLVERCVRDLMRLTARSGDRAGALNAYESLVERLRAELGSEPHRETVRLADKIREELGEIAPTSIGSPTIVGSAIGRPLDSVAAPSHSGGREAWGRSVSRSWPRGLWRVAAVPLIAVAAFSVAGILGSGRDAADGATSPVLIVQDLRNESGVDSLDFLGTLAADVITLATVRRLPEVDVLRAEGAEGAGRSGALLLAGAYVTGENRIRFRARLTTTGGDLIRTLGPFDAAVQDPTDGLGALAEDLGVAVGSHLVDDAWIFRARRVGTMPSWDTWRPSSGWTLRSETTVMGASFRAPGTPGASGRPRHHGSPNGRRASGARDDPEAYSPRRRSPDRESARAWRYCDNQETTQQAEATWTPGDRAGR